VRVVIRADAASHVGIGHVMRCLTLANALKAKGAEVCFVCRPFVGHLGERIVFEGHSLHMLPPATQAIKPAPDMAEIPPHSPWLGESWETDLTQTQAMLRGMRFDWLVVDHYSVDARWEGAMRKISNKVMVIDDTADRMHDCDLLLDQTFGRKKEIYKSRVPEDCNLLIGSSYALLRPEFAELREHSLNRRAKFKMERLIISMGGMDENNITCQVLEALRHSALPSNCCITVVMGNKMPWLDKVRMQAEKMTWPTEVKVGVSNMAQLMVESDLAIGAAGGTSWERCCLGLPTLMVILASNQRDIGLALAQEQAVILLHDIPDIKNAIELVCATTKKLSSMSHASRKITDGSGIETILNIMTS